MDDSPNSSPSEVSGGRGRTSRQLLRNSASSYGRLLGTFVIGLIVTPYLGREEHMGLAGFGLFALLMSSVGIINIIQTTVRSALVRDLSRAFHGGEAREIRAAFTAALASSALLGVALGAAMLLGTPVAMWVFQFGPHFADQMWWSWITLSAFTTWVVVTVPFITLLDATHRIPQRNFEMFIERAASLVAAVIVFSQPWGRAHPLIAYIAGNCLLTALIRGVTGAWAYFTCPDVGIDLATLERKRLGEIFRTGGHVGQGEIANNLYDRTNQLLINIFLGATLNGLFGVVALLVGYTKQIAMGISFGVEPMAAKFSQNREGGRELIGGFVLAMTRVQSGVVFPIIAVLILMGQILINHWLGDRFSSQRFAANRDIAQMLMILLVGSPFFVIMQGPLRIMLGAGDVRAYASRLFQAGILQAVLAALILWLVPGQVRERYGPRITAEAIHEWGSLLGPGLLIAEMKVRLLAENAAMYAVAASMSIIYLLVYGLFVPILACALYDLRLRDMYFGAIAPGAGIGLVVACFLALYRWWVNDWSLWLVFLALALAGLLSAALFWWFVLSGQERRRLGEAFRLRPRAA
ncbi:MAG: hypothetical protein KJZ69_04540 [Phycisphaerales bacterium]|nr:hypothetical protein [Phycisphaerales bacterium]